MTTAAFDSFCSTPWSLTSASSSADSSIAGISNSPPPSSPAMSFREQIDILVRQEKIRLDSNDWKFILGRIKQEMYTNTGAGLPSPTAFIAEEMNHPDTDKKYVDISTGDDIAAYRQMRSDCLVTRMFGCMNVDVDVGEVISLGKGVYIHSIVRAPMEFGDPFDELLNQIVQTAFVPYSYTFGARYTDAFGYTSDIVIRGNMPVWVQGLFLAECLKQENPIRAGDSRTGLFVFAPAVTARFESLDWHPQQYIINPELTIIYEKIAFDFTDPDALFSEGATQTASILKRILVCDIPDPLAHTLTQLAMAWASSQGFML